MKSALCDWVSFGLFCFVCWILIDGFVGVAGILNTAWHALVQ